MPDLYGIPIIAREDMPPDLIVLIPSDPRRSMPDDIDYRRTAETHLKAVEASASHIKDPTEGLVVLAEAVSALAWAVLSLHGMGVRTYR